MWEPNEFDYGHPSGGLGEAIERGLILANLESSPEAITLGAHRVVFRDAWLERKTKYEWSMFVGRLVNDPEMEVIVLSFEVVPDDGETILFSPVVEQARIASTVPSSGRWYCVVPKGFQTIDVEAWLRGKGERARFTLSRVTEQP
ncbi:MAG TPA: hypothetical protein VIK52_13015 [Opitutaceae bacterium]